MAGPGFETTCPVCAHVFDVPADAPEAPCPSCRSIIEFAEPEDLEQQQRRLEAERAARDEAKRQAAQERRRRQEAEAARRKAEADAKRAEREKAKEAKAAERALSLINI